jgi:hypothetical protein
LSYTCLPWWSTQGPGAVPVSRISIRQYRDDGVMILD